MDDLLHTSCHFNICLKSHTTGTTAWRDPTAAFRGTVYFDAFASQVKYILLKSHLGEYNINIHKICIDKTTPSYSLQNYMRLSITYHSQIY